MMKKTVTIYTDGACSGNPGPGGWGAILCYGGAKKEMSGGEKQTTNNRMELTGVISALRALKEPCIVELYSDSKYVIDALSKGWAVSWRRNGWKRPIKSRRSTPTSGQSFWSCAIRMRSAATGSRATPRTNSITAAMSLPSRPRRPCPHGECAKAIESGGRRPQ